MKLADRFQVEWLTQRCEQYYLRRFKPALFPPLRILLETLKETIRLADKYRLRKLMVSEVPIIIYKRSLHNFRTPLLRNLLTPTP